MNEILLGTGVSGFIYLIYQQYKNKWALRTLIKLSLGAEKDPQIITLREIDLLIEKGKWE